MAQKMIEWVNPGYPRQSLCCKKFSVKEANTWWPLPRQENKNNVIPEETLDLALKWFQTRFKLQGFNYKISKKTNCLTLLQLVFTHGVKSAMAKANNETEDNIETTLLTDGQYLASVKRERIDQLRVKDLFMDQNGKVFFSCVWQFPREKDITPTREMDGYIHSDISNRNFVCFSVCERHDNHLLWLAILFVPLNI